MTNDDLHAAISSVKDATDLLSLRTRSSFNEIGVRLDGHDRRFDRLETRLGNQFR